MKKYFLISALSITVNLLYTQPVVTGINGNIAQKQSLIINGVNFGTKVPAAPLIWDDFEGGVNNIGDSIPNVDPKWSWAGGLHQPLIYENDWSHSGMVSAKAIPSAGQGELFPTNRQWTDVLYMTNWIKTADCDNSDRGAGFAGKFNRMNCSLYGSPATYNGPLCHNFGFFQSFEAVYPGTVSMAFSVSVCADNIGGQGGNTANQPAKFEFNREIRVEHYAKLNTPGVANGSAYMNHIGIGSFQVSGLTQRQSGCSLQFDTPAFMLACANRSSTFNAKFWGDDFYADITQARVELGDSALFSSCTHREIQIPTAWSANSIIINVNQGSFKNCDTAYLFVIDKDGIVNSNGYMVIINQSACATKIDNYNTFYDFSIHPNPNNGTFIVSFMQTASDYISVEITNIMGEKIYNEQLYHFSGKFEKQISLEKFSKGLYVLQVKTRKNTVSKKIVMQ